MWEQLFIDAIVKALGDAVNGVEEHALTPMLRYWVFDVSGNDAELWWGILDKLPKSMEGEVTKFLELMVSCFGDNLAFLDDYGRMGPMLQELAPRFTGAPNSTAVRNRFKENDAYGDFVRYVQEDLVLTVPVLCLLGGEMSGDMFGIGATLLIDPDVRVLVMTGADLALDHTADIESFLSICDPERVDTCLKSEATRVIGEIFKKTNQVFLPMPYYLGTLYMSFPKYWQDQEARGWIRDGWGVSNDGGFSGKCPKVAKWLVGRGIPLQKMEGAKVLVLWSRFTGKKGEIHVEHDTSFEGMRQLASEAVKLGYHVIITGDRPIVHQLAKKPDREKKFNLICEQVNSEYKETRVFNLTGFWSDPNWKQLASTRTVQFCLFELLHRFCDTRHLGMRSGNLEAMALMGFCVRYMEEVDSQGGERMSAWHGIGLGYERIVIEAPPTRTGKWVVHEYHDKPIKEDKKPKTYPKKLPWIAARNVGILGTVGDLSKIKIKPMNEKQKKRAQTKGSRNKEPTTPIVVRETPQQEVAPEKLKPNLEHFERGFATVDRVKVCEFLASQNNCPRLEHLPLHWASLLDSNK